MATVVLGLLGAGIGAFVGGPQGAMLGWSAGVTLAGVVFPPRISAQERGRIDDVRVTGSGYGAFIPQVWGSARVGGNVIWATDLVEHKNEEHVGGKGGGGAQVTEYTYFANFACAVCQGEIDHIRRIWADDILIYDHSKTPATKYQIIIHRGGEDMLPSEFIEAHEGVGNVPAYRGLCYVTFQHLPLAKWSNRIPVMSFEVVASDSGAATVQDVAASIFEQCGLASNRIDTSGGATRSVEGYFLSSRESGADFLGPLLQITNVDLCEYDGKLRLVPSGGAVDLTINSDDLGCTFFDESDGAEKVDVRRVQDFELPNEVSVTFFNKDRKYETGHARAIRYCKNHVAEKLTVTVPAVLTMNAARRIAETLLYKQWVEREQFKFRLPLSYLKTAPGSVVYLPVADGLTRAKVVGIDFALIGPLDVTAVFDDDSTLSQIVTAEENIPPEDELFTPDTTLFYPFNTNALIDDHADSIGLYLAASGDSGWNGVQVYLAGSGSGSYQPVKVITGHATWGTALTVLSPGESTGLLDTVNTVDIQLEEGLIETTSFELLLSNANAAILGGEVIQFLSVEALGLGAYRLSGLVRGRRGTDYAWDNHAIGERFLLLNDSVVRLKLKRSYLGKTVLLKAVNETESLADVSPVSIKILGKERKPYSPVQIVGTRDMTGNLDLTWIRRARKDADLQDGSDVPLDESFERYKVEIWTAGFGAVVRTLTGLTSPAATYTAADQTTDFGAPQNPVSLKVYQLGDFKPDTTSSRATGYAGTAVI
jgi:hypothetical protein